MLVAGGRVQGGFRYGSLGLVALLAALTISGSADARFRRHHRHHHHRTHVSAAERYQPSTASIVVDANSGAVMEESNADSLRHPASLSKVMTLYLLFERMEAGKINLSSELPVSAHAAVQAPTKLGLTPGQSISVGTAIRSIVTKSANDAAVVVAEALGGSEENFAKLMTAKAHGLGMMHTNYHNASGLPDDKQITTARDQAILARGIQDRFPEYYHYFATRSFEYHGREMRNHNHLLGRIAGVDGIKTGYIHDSGFNIMVSMRRGNRHVVAVVFGGRTARARDARVVGLLEDKIKVAAVKRTAPPVVEGWELAAARAKHNKQDSIVEKEEIAAHVPLPRVARLAKGSTTPIKPHPVKAFIVHGSAHAESEIHTLRPVPADDHSTVTPVVTVKREAPLPQGDADPGVLVTAPVKVASDSDEAPTPQPAAKSHTGWMIQIGAFDNEKEAKQRLNTAQDKAKKLLHSANPFTEAVEKGDKTYYRARFAGLEKDQAAAACRHLRRRDIPCIVLKD